MPSIILLHDLSPSAQKGLTRIRTFAEHLFPGTAIVAVPVTPQVRQAPRPSPAVREEIEKLAPCQYFSRERLRKAGYLTAGLHARVMKVCANFGGTMHDLIPLVMNEGASKGRKIAPRVSTIMRYTLLADGITNKTA